VGKGRGGKESGNAPPSIPASKRRKAWGRGGEGRKVGTPLHQFQLLREEKDKEGEKGRGAKDSRNAPPSIPAFKRRKA